MSKLCKRLILCFSTICTLLAGCSETVYVTQQRQTYNDYKAMKYGEVINKTKKPKVRTKQ